MQWLQIFETAEKVHKYAAGRTSIVVIVIGKKLLLGV